MPFGSAMVRSASALGFSTLERWSDVPLDDRPRGIGGGTGRARLRIAIAVAAAAPAASNAVPAITLGQRRACGFGGSSRRAVAASMYEILGATFSCTVTLPRAALTAIHARIRPTRGLAHPAAPVALCLAVMAALLVIGRA
jgi:hypothetical protein